MRQNLNIITLGAIDFQKSVDFYEKGLGWKKSAMSQGDIAFFDLNGIVLAIYPRDLLAEDALLLNNGSGFPGFTLAHNCKSALEVDEILKQVELLGADIIKPAQKVFWGGYSGYFRNLDGFIFEMAYNPFIEFDEHENLRV